MKSKVAVISMTRDRLEYTKICFESLREKAGCKYDHYILDNGSTDGTQKWLVQNVKAFRKVLLSPSNLGLAEGFNTLLNMLCDRYDVVIKIDNDCLIKTDNTMEQVISIMESFNMRASVSPRVEGLNRPPKAIRKEKLNGYNLSEVGHFGGIFYPLPINMATPIKGKLYMAKGLDSMLSERLRSEGKMRLFYVEDLRVEHFETTNGQSKKYPDYFSRKKVEENQAVTI